MKINLSPVGLLLLVTGCLYAQSDRGTVTGTLSDPAGAAVPGGPLEARNVNTGAAYQTASSETGNYTLSQLPVGTYEISATVPGFKKYVRQNIQVGVAQTLRVDIVLEIGAASESVTVTETAPLLKTESGELSHNVGTDRLNNLPILPVSGAVRNPLAATQLAPGTTFNNALIRVNGAPGNTQSVRIEGQDATNGYLLFSNTQVQPSVDAIQEVSIQTSNFAAEYGQAGGGFFNFTMKSGTNNFHGSAYDYIRNEALYAGQAWTNNGRGDLIRPADKQHNYGGTIGGPVWIPKVYNGRDKTFFFFNIDRFRRRQIIATEQITVPTDRFRLGDFSDPRVYTGRVLGTDPIGRSILENAIYDPTTQRAAPNGQIIRDPFQGNVIPQNRMDPIALKIQQLIPAPTTSSLIQNLIIPFAAPHDVSIPSLKVDHSLNDRQKLSVFWTQTNLNQPATPGALTGMNEGLPVPITAGRGNLLRTYSLRANYDYSLSPTLLLHLGAGFQDYDFKDQAKAVPYDAQKELGIPGIPFARQFPQFRDLSSVSYGGMKNMGPDTQATNRFVKPSATASLTWVKSNHTYRAGGEFRTEGFFREDFTNSAGNFQFSPLQTGLPSTQGQALQGGTVGFAYASFLLGQVNQTFASMPARPRLGKHILGFYVQDTWKVTRKLTLDYGLRYDYQSYYQEQYGRQANFSPSTPNPLFSGRLGAPIFEGSGPGRCGCDFASNYPFALGPRLGVAYQITPKTIFRGGVGVVYSATGLGGAGTALGVVTSPAIQGAGSTGPNQPVTTLSQGLPPTPQWPNISTDVWRFGTSGSGGSSGQGPTYVDRNAGRPARQIMWSLGFQQQIMRDLVAEVYYVGNRGAWWNAPGLTQLNSVGPSQIAAAGLDLSKAEDRNLLTSSMSSPLAVARGFSTRLPFPGFPTNQLVVDSLRPFPQFGNIANLWVPTGNTWYDSMQAKVTKRFSRGLDFSYVLTWSKSMALGTVCEQCLGGAAAVVTDPDNRQINKQISGYNQPIVSTFAGSYTLPVLRTNKFVSWAVRDWQIGALLTYSSGLPIRVPSANNGLANQLRGSTVNASRVAGEPLYTVDLNCHCYDPSQVFVLNPRAWQDPAAGTFGTAASYYSDYRYQRRPQENASIGRVFRIKEKVQFQIRGEFFNIFNRLQIPDPTATNAGATPVRGANGVTQSGFGRINTLSPAVGFRTGQLLARITF